MPQSCIKNIRIPPRYADINDIKNILCHVPFIPLSLPCGIILPHGDFKEEKHELLRLTGNVSGVCLLFNFNDGQNKHCRRSSRKNAEDHIRRNESRLPPGEAALHHRFHSVAVHGV